MPRQAHQPTKESRQLVQLHAAVGTPVARIAEIMEISEKTLRKHYRTELDLGQAKANATIGGALFNSAKDGNTTAQIFWLKTRAGWRETNRIEHGIDDGTIKPTVIQLIPHQEDAETDGED